MGKNHDTTSHRSRFVKFKLEGQYRILLLNKFPLTDEFKSMIGDWSESDKLHIVKKNQDRLDAGKQSTISGFVDVKMLNILSNIDQSMLGNLNIKIIYVYLQPLTRDLVNTISAILKKRTVETLRLNNCNLKEEYFDQLLECRENVKKWITFFY